MGEQQLNTLFISSGINVLVGGKSPSQSLEVFALNSTKSIAKSTVLLVCSPCVLAAFWSKLQLEAVVQRSQPSARGRGWWLEGAFFGCQQMLATLPVCYAGVGGMLFRMHMAAGHFNPLELHSSPFTSGRKDPKTLEGVLKTISVVRCQCCQCGSSWTH